VSFRPDADVDRVGQNGETVEGLALPQAVLEKFYGKNAERIIGVR
jgi:hypothetical protein